MGVALLMTTTYLLGRFPNSHYYNYHSGVIVMLVIIRLFYYRSRGWHYYLFDFCYFANSLMLYFILVSPKSDYLFKICFVYATGTFGMAIGAFRNSMVFHKLDNLTSVCIHAIPLATFWNIRWVTIPYEATLSRD